MFCAGAWLSVIVMAAAVIDASLRGGVSGFQGNTKDLIDAAPTPEVAGFARVGTRRSTYHPTILRSLSISNGPTAKLESEARDAVKLMTDAMFLTLGMKEVFEWTISTMNHGA